MTWLVGELDHTIQEFLKNPVRFNKTLNKNLPLRYRYGKIKRSCLWHALSETTHFDTELGKTNIKKLEKIVQSKSSTYMPTMTLKTYLHACDICYRANTYHDYTKKTINRLSPIEKYKAMSDGRHMGLLDIPYEDAHAFETWFDSSARLGGHPWEICRGGNSTHIDLAVHKTNKGWMFILVGMSRVRVIETVRMAIVLYENTIPFIFSHKREILRMVQGNDYVGIVPQGVIPRYCHSSFPKKDRIVDFMNLPIEDNEVKKMLSFITWYPLNPLVKKIKVTRKGNTID